MAKNQGNRNRGSMILELAGVAATTLRDVGAAIIGPGKTQEPEDPEPEARDLKAGDPAADEPAAGEPAAGEPEVAGTEPDAAGETAGNGEDEFLSPGGYHTPAFYREEILNALRDGNGIATLQEIQDRVLTRLGPKFTREDLESPPGRWLRWKMNLSNCGSDMARRHGLMKRGSPPGIWKLTGAGREEAGLPPAEEEPDAPAENPEPEMGEPHPAEFFMEPLMRKFFDNGGTLFSSQAVREIGDELDAQLTPADREHGPGSHAPRWWRSVRRCWEKMRRMGMLRDDAPIGTWVLNNHGRVHVGLPPEGDKAQAEEGWDQVSPPAEWLEEAGPGEAQPEAAQPEAAGPDATGPEQPEPGEERAGAGDGTGDASRPTLFSMGEEAENEPAHKAAFYRDEVLRCLVENRGRVDDLGMREHIHAAMRSRFNSRDLELGNNRRPHWENQLANCRQQMRRRGLIEHDGNPQKWRLTQAGWDAARELESRAAPEGEPESQPEKQPQGRNQTKNPTGEQAQNGTGKETSPRKGTANGSRPGSGASPPPRSRRTPLYTGTPPAEPGDPFGEEAA